MKMPNGFGNVSKLSGNRRKPWRARKTEEWKLVNGKKKQIFTTIGYYETRALAIQALAEYNANPWDISAASITLKEVYEKWSADKFEGIAASNINGYKASWKLCEAIQDVKFMDLNLSHLESVVKTSGKNYPTLKKLKTLFSQLYAYAISHSIITRDKDIVEYLDIGQAKKSDKHYRFTEDEIDTMWEWSKNNDYVQVILMLIYSGVRPGELFNLKKEDVDIENKIFNVKKGKNENAIRKVPIHDRILPFFENWMQKNESPYLVTQLNGKQIKFDTNHGQYVDSYWKPLLLEMRILNYENSKGETKEHSPDDTRHTFTTMWKEKKLDEAMRRKIQGHSGKGIGEIVYTHFEIEKLREELNCL